MVALFPDIGADAEWGQIFTQACLYGYVLSIGADLIGDGAELLMLCPSIAPLVGSIVVPILGAVPDGMMVLCSGLGDDAQNQINVGVGALAGSTVMLLTLPWFLSIWKGRVTIKDGAPNYRATDGKKLQDIQGNAMAQVYGALVNSGVAVHEQVKVNAKIMFTTTIPFLVIQVPTFFVDNSEHDMATQKTFERPFGIVGCIMCVILFADYMRRMLNTATLEGSDVKNQIAQKTVEGIKGGHLTLCGAMHEFREEVMQELEEVAKGGGGETGVLQKDLSKSLLDKGKEKQKAKAESTVLHMCDVLKPFFKKYDQDGDQKINKAEFKSLLLDLGEKIDEEHTNVIFEAADIDKSGTVEFEEFVACIMAFALDPKRKDLDSPNQGGGDEGGGGGGGEEGDEEEEDMPPDLADLDPKEQQKAIKQRACWKMFIGSVIVLLFSDPMCDLLGTMGDKADIPPFYISFLIAPLASNASELVSAMTLAAKKTEKSMRQSLSTLCGAAIMNNTFCLSIFFLVFIIQDLVWKFSAETISIVSIQYAVGAIAILKPSQTLLEGLFILCLYPAAMGIVYVLKTYVGLD